MKKIIIIITCICTLCAFGVLTYFIYVHQSVANYLEIAQTAMRVGDIKKAEEFFLKVIKHDKMNEAAYQALAEIAEKNEKLVWAAVYWKTVASLNPLSKKFYEKYINALLATYQYSTILELLDHKIVTDLSNFELYALIKAGYTQKPLRETKVLLALLRRSTKSSSKDPKVTLLQADIFLSTQNFQEARKLFTSLADCPDKKIRTSALIGLGNIDLLSQKTKKAGISYEKAVKAAPDSLKALMILANYNLVHGKAKDAQPQYEKLHKRFPKNLLIAIILAEIYAEKKNIVAIRKTLNHVDATSQTAVAAKYYLRAMLAYVENDPGKLKQNLRFCNAFRDRPFYMYMQFSVILASNDSTRIKRYVAILLKINNSLVARTDLYNKIVPLVMEDFKSNKFKKVAVLTTIMQELLPRNTEAAHLAMVNNFYQQKWREAIRAADEFNGLCPDTLDYLSIKGRSLLYLNEAESALPLLKKITFLSPEKADIWLWLAQAYQLLDEQKKVEVCIEKMLQFAGNSHAVIDPAVTFFIAQKNMKIADKIARRLQSSQDTTFKAMAWSIKAQSAQKNKQWQDAVEYLIKAYDLEKNSDTLLYISDIYVENKQYGNALQYVKKALRDIPDSPKALFRQAVIVQGLKDYEQAIKLYKKLLVKYPQWSMVLVNLSDIMAIKGEAREALNLAKQAQEKAFSWPRAQFCLALRELDCKNYTAALRILNLLVIQEPENKIFKKAVFPCLVGIIKEHIENKSFRTAKLRLEQFKKAAPDSSESTFLENLLKAKEKASKAASKK